MRIKSVLLFPRCFMDVIHAPTLTTVAMDTATVWAD